MVESIKINTASINTASLLFLGTGASTAVPVIACSCATCQSSNPKNKRLRTSALLQLNDKQILIDAGPDIRIQALTHHINRLDALFLTHTHYDHIGGVEELRIFNFLQESKMACYLSGSSMDSFKKLFYYHFNGKSEFTNYTAEFDFTVLDNKQGHFDLFGHTFTYFGYTQGGMDVLGFRVGNLAYVTDIKEYSEDIFDHLKGLDTLIVSAQRFGRSKIQFSFDEACSFAERVGAKTTYLTHLSHEIEYQHGEALLRQGMHLAYDGLKIPIRVP